MTSPFYWELSAVRGTNDSAEPPGMLSLGAQLAQPLKYCVASSHHLVCVLSSQQSRPTSPSLGLNLLVHLELSLFRPWITGITHIWKVVCLGAVLVCSAIIILFLQLWECVDHKCSQIFSWEIHPPNPNQGRSPLCKVFVKLHLFSHLKTVVLWMTASGKHPPKLTGGPVYPGGPTGPCIPGNPGEPYNVLRKKRIKMQTRRRLSMGL